MVRWWNNSWNPRYVIALVVILLIGGYALSRSWNLLAGPELIINTPIEGQAIKDSFITVSGEAERIASLHLNGRQIFTTTDGHFNESLLLLPGYNIIVITAEDKFGRELIKKITLINDEV
ncbi:MAG: hypothetical protein KBC48_01840 [Candidatus Pacebacteria bacterium]|nr:hypothetical protein [Candidatus Paceibacterota bacterium]